MAIRTYANDVVITCGPFSARGRLLGVKNSSASRPKYKLCSPSGQRVDQRYVDSDGNVFERSDLGQAYEEDGKLIQVDPEAIAEAKSTTLPLNQLTLVPHPASEVNQYLYPSGEHQGYATLVP